MAVEDKNFHSYIETKQEKFHEGGSQDEDNLMTLANNKFTLLTEAGRYNMPSADEEKILALQAELKSVLKKTKQNSKGKAPKSETTNSKSVDWKDKSAAAKKKASEKPGWMSEKPKEENLRKSKSWNKKDWYWCSPETGGKCNGHWRVHKPSKCEGRAHKFGEKHQTGAAKGQSEKKKLKLAQAISAIQDGSDEEPESVADNDSDE